MQTLEKQQRRGMDAKEFKTYLRDNPYFPSLVNELDSEIAESILGLDPSDKESFSLLQARRLALRLTLDRVESDIIMGNEATRELEGRPIEGGIL